MLRKKGFYKGVNFGGWFSQCDYSKERLDNFITEKDVAEVSTWGIDHVRLPFDYNIIQNSDGTFIQEGFDRIEKAVDMCRKYGLNVVLDLHKTVGFSFDNYSENEHGFFENTDYQERFYSLWEKVAERFGTLSNLVAFELLNEVTDREYINAWNRIVNTCIKRIRSVAPDSLILVGSYWNNSSESVKDLDSPYDDKVIYNMHCYAPLKFTHQGAYWTDMINQEERFSFDEIGCNEQYFEKLFESAIEKAEQNNTFLYCGEYGVIDRANPQDILKWFKCIHSVFEKFDIGRCAWNYKNMDFGISDPHFDDIREELVKYL